MGVDHGLGGKETAKAKLRREKKAKRVKNIAKSLRSEDVPVNAHEVKFDENARVAWLTGFRKRKQERRKYGIAMQLLKDKKARKDSTKEKKRVMLEQSQHLLDARNAALNAEEQQEDQLEGMKAEEQVYEDEATREMFGAPVSVSIVSTLDNAWFGNQNSFDADDNIQTNSTNPKKRKHEPTKLEKALKQATVMMNNTKKNKDNYKRHASREVRKKVDSSKLLDKAMGRMHSKGKGRKGR